MRCAYIVIIKILISQNIKDMTTIRWSQELAVIGVNLIWWQSIRLNFQNRHVWWWIDSSLTSKLLTNNLIPKIDFSQDNRIFDRSCAQFSRFQTVQKGWIRMLENSNEKWHESPMWIDFITRTSFESALFQNEKIPFRFTIMETIARRRSGGTIAGTQSRYWKSGII